MQVIPLDPETQTEPFHVVEEVFHKERDSKENRDKELAIKENIQKEKSIKEVDYKSKLTDELGLKSHAAYEAERKEGDAKVKARDEVQGKTKAVKSKESAMKVSSGDSCIAAGYEALQGCESDHHKEMQAKTTELNAKIVEAKRERDQKELSEKAAVEAEAAEKQAVAEKAAKEATIQAAIDAAASAAAAGSGAGQFLPGASGSGKALLPTQADKGPDAATSPSSAPQVHSYGETASACAALDSLTCLTTLGCKIKLVKTTSGKISEAASSCVVGTDEDDAPEPTPPTDAPEEAEDFAPGSVAAVQNASKAALNASLSAALANLAPSSGFAGNSSRRLLAKAAWGIEWHPYHTVVAGGYRTIKTSLKEFTEETGTQCMDDSGAVQNIGVTCCDPMGIGHRPECLKSVSRIEAKEHCEKFNMTLCSAQALMNGAGEDDGRLGCDFDATMQWSSTHCDSPVLPHAVDKTMHGGAENVSTSANLSTTLATQATLAGAANITDTELAVLEEAEAQALLDALNETQSCASWNVSQCSAYCHNCTVDTEQSCAGSAVGCTSRMCCKAGPRSTVLVKDVDGPTPGQEVVQMATPANMSVEGNVSAFGRNCTQEQDNAELKCANAAKAKLTAQEQKWAAAAQKEADRYRAKAEQEAATNAKASKEGKKAEEALVEVEKHAEHNVEDAVNQAQVKSEEAAKKLAEALAARPAGPGLGHLAAAAPPANQTAEAPGEGSGEAAAGGDMVESDSAYTKKVTAKPKPAVAGWGAWGAQKSTPHQEKVAAWSSTMDNLYGPGVVALLDEDGKVKPAAPYRCAEELKQPYETCRSGLNEAYAACAASYKSIQDVYLAT